jgi:predicted MFS family arabinose efflux permease
VPLALVVVVLLAGGACGPALLGGLTSQVSALVPEASLPRAFGLDSLTYNVSGIVGPALAGVLSGVAGAGAAAAVLACSAACGAALLATLPLDPSPSEATPRLRDGALLVLRDRVLGAVTIASSLGQLGPGALPVVATVLAARLHVAAAAGWLMTAIAAGGLLGSLAWTWKPLPARRAPVVVMGALIGVGAPLGLAGAAPLPAVAGLFALSGCFLGPFTGALFTTRRERAPEHLQAQVFSLGGGLKTAAAAAGAALAGALAHTATATQLLLVAACPVLAGVVGLLVLGPVRARRPMSARA